MKKLNVAALAMLGLIGCDDGETDTGPCLSIEQTETESESSSDTETARASDALRDDAREGVRDRVLDRDVLPADVAERLRRKV